MKSYSHTDDLSFDKLDEPAQLKRQFIQQGSHISNFGLNRNGHSQPLRLFGWLSIAVLIACANLFGVHANAHSPNENYVWVNVDKDRLSGRFEINVSDLKSKLNVDVDAAGENRDAGVVATAAPVQQYLLENFSVSENGRAFELTFGKPTVFADHPKFIQYPFTAQRLPEGDEIQVKSTVFLSPEMMRDDSRHRSVLVVAYNRLVDKEFGEERVAMVFTPERTEQTVNLAEPPGILSYKDFLWQGMLHIWIGLDHVIFLVVLLLTSVLRYDANGWKPVEGPKQALINIAVIVTIFTVAHAITLSLTALNLVTFNIGLIETIIALSIVVVAFNNIYPRFAAHTWLLIFVFGLIHGIGFASAMGDLQYRMYFINRILVLFNVGVEVGQLVIVLILFPILYLLRRHPKYRVAVVYPVSILAILIAGYWVIERGAGLFA